MLARFVAAIAAMVVVVTASNILVQYPVQSDLGPIHLGDLLTWGAFTYPFAFLVTDLTNRYDGPVRARMVVVVGFVVALALSAYLATPRIAIASATAFLIGQLLDISVFSRLRASRSWFLPPLAASLFGSLLDTLIFFSIAFAPALGFVDGLFGMEDGSLGFPAPWLGVGGEVPLWTSLATGDFLVKFLAALLLLAPYRLLMGRLMPLQPVPKAA
ncbi:MAG: rane protein [Devosia sp.]|uniref:queuosine precursor transporter n=1 Tax=Devosia sp. TaxID=1871048 RepID=UPI0026078696|nr:queuosine precursor transporter [Devosia sp.]MDB5540009.1 rane protein [Devosia sp.]